MSDLNNDFDTLAEQINAKLKEAAAAVREANRLGDKLGLPALICTQQLYDDLVYQNRGKENPLSQDDIEDKMKEYEDKLEKIDVGELESALSDAGWSTSSSYC